MESCIISLKYLFKKRNRIHWKLPDKEKKPAVSFLPVSINCSVTVPGTNDEVLENYLPPLE